MPGFASPEEAALNTWVHTPAAAVQVVSVEMEGDIALVVIADAPGHYDNNTCQRGEDGLWRTTGSTGTSGAGRLHPY